MRYILLVFVTSIVCFCSPNLVVAQTCLDFLSGTRALSDESSVDDNICNLVQPQIIGDACDVAMLETARTQGKSEACERTKASLERSVSLGSIICKPVDQCRLLFVSPVTDTCAYTEIVPCEVHTFEQNYQEWMQRCINLYISWGSTRSQAAQTCVLEANNGAPFTTFNPGSWVSGCIFEATYLWSGVCGPIANSKIAAPY